MPLTFQPLAYGDRITVINPAGDVGLITLWSPQRSVLRKLEAVAPSVVDPAASRIAAVANLYGDGLFSMLRNLRFNPQLRHLVVVGQDLGLGVPDELEALLADGVEETTVFGQALLRVRGTARLLPMVEGFDARVLQERLTLTRLGKVGALDAGFAEMLAGLPVHEAPVEGDRVLIEEPADATADRTYRPSNPQAHTVTRRRPLDAWEELVVRTMRFGRPTQLRKGARLELLNAKVVIAEPVEESAEALAEYGFDLERFHAYGRSILDPVLPEGISYTYGNRLRGHFSAGAAVGSDATSEAAGAREDGVDAEARVPFDALTAAADRLRRDPEARGAYVSLWDTPLDLDAYRSGPPCLTTLFFRLHDGRLTLTATYRSHNLLTAWLQNVYGLMAIQRFVTEAAGLPPGAITVLSHSLTIDPASPRLAIGRAIEQGWQLDDEHDRETDKFSLREDPNGYFVVSIDEDAGELIAEHRADGLLLKRYTGTSANTLGREIAADMGVSLVSHALWLGGELQRWEGRLAAARAGRPDARTAQPVEDSPQTPAAEALDPSITPEASVSMEPR